MKKIFSLLFFVLIFSTNIFALTFDFEIPIKIEIAKTENEIDYNYSGTNFLDFPIPFLGPIRALYIFNPDSESRWTFGAGLSSYVYPLQTLSASGKAAFKLKTFSNKSTLELENLLDIGLLMKFTDYYNVKKGSRDINTSVSPIIEYAFLVAYRTNGKIPFHVGLGPNIAVACFDGSVKIYYGFNTNLGFQINFGK